MNTTVHPRVHGELASSLGYTLTLTGSSPRTRGTLVRRPGRVVQDRFIPAYTGNSGSRTAGWSRRAVHPRVHGELNNKCSRWRLYYGSSPRTRGTRGHDRAGDDRAGFIPAYTGNSRSRQRGTGRRPVHPRVHGELAAIQTVETQPDGSSPRTRGTRIKYKY